MEPCQKANEIDAIQERLKDGDKALVELRVKQVEIAGDVQHVKQKLDNGMSTSIKRIEDTIIALKPIIEHHADIVKRVEDFGWLISRVAASSLLVIIFSLIVWAIAKGFVPKI